VDVTQLETTNSHDGAEGTGATVRAILDETILTYAAAMGQAMPLEQVVAAGPHRDAELI
jgi:hypothetical protein